MSDAPPQPPPHSAKSSKLPDGNYDIFIIPPHSAGSGFLYLPSLKPNINSFVAGFFTAVLAIGIWSVVTPAFKQIAASASGGLNFVLAIALAGAAFAIGRTQGEGSPDHRPEPGRGSSAGGSAGNTQYTSGAYSGPPPTQESGPPPGPRATPGPQPGSASASAGAGPKPSTAGGASAWEKAREETRKREQERKRAEELKKAQEAAQKKKEEEEKAKRAAAEKLKWEQARAREKDAREREARERLTKDKTPKPARYEKPYVDTASDASSYRNYESARERRNPLGSSASSVSGVSESSYAPSMSTARTTPPPRHRGPYSTNDPEKVVIKGVYLFNNMFPKPISQLVSNEGSVTDGLVLKITTEGLFIDDDVRGVPQREWDVKAWGIKLVETGKLGDVNVFRASLRDTDAKKYVFVLPADQGWKVDMGLERLRKGSQVRSMGMQGLKEAEMKNILGGLGWLA